MARIRPSATAIKRPASVTVRDRPRPSPAPIVLDPHRAFVFPNRIREQRRRRGLLKLMALSDLLPDIPYIRLSKVERGEVVARASELRKIAMVLDIVPTDLLIDFTRPGFDMAGWAQPFQDGRPAPGDEERFAVLLAAAVRVLRDQHASLTIARLDKDYGLPPVILSRIENAQKTLDRWNAATIAALCRLFEVADESHLRDLVMTQYRAGALDGLVGRIADPDARFQRTRDRNAALWAEVSSLSPTTGRATTPGRHTELATPTAGPSSPSPAAAAVDWPREVPVFGTALPGGLIAFTPTATVVDAPRHAGARAFALRVCRATLGAGLPASAIVVVDPDRQPAAGGLAAIRTAEGYRLVSITFDRMGATKGYSVMPDMEVSIDDLDPADVGGIIAAIFP